MVMNHLCIFRESHSDQLYLFKCLNLPFKSPFLISYRSEGTSELSYFVTILHYSCLHLLFVTNDGTNLNAKKFNLNLLILMSYFIVKI